MPEHFELLCQVLHDVAGPNSDPMRPARNFVSTLQAKSLERAANALADVPPEQAITAGEFILALLRASEILIKPTESLREKNDELEDLKSRVPGSEWSMDARYSSLSCLAYFGSTPKSNASRFFTTTQTRGSRPRRRETRASESGESARDARAGTPRMERSENN